MTFQATEKNPLPFRERIFWRYLNKGLANRRKAAVNAAFSAVGKGGRALAKANRPCLIFLEI